MTISRFVRACYFFKKLSKSIRLIASTCYLKVPKLTFQNHLKQPKQQTLYVPATPNYSLRNPKYHLLENARPLIEVPWTVYVHGAFQQAFVTASLRMLQSAPAARPQTRQSRGPRVLCPHLDLLKYNHKEGTLSRNTLDWVAVKASNLSYHDRDTW